MTDKGLDTGEDFDAMTIDELEEHALQAGLVAKLSVEGAVGYDYQMSYPGAGNGQLVWDRADVDLEALVPELDAAGPEGTEIADAVVEKHVAELHEDAMQERLVLFINNTLRLVSDHMSYYRGEAERFMPGNVPEDSKEEDWDWEGIVAEIEQKVPEEGAYVGRIGGVGYACYARARLKAIQDRNLAS